MASNSVFPPSSEPLVLARKRAREKKLEPDIKVEVLEELEWNKIPRRTVVNPSSEPKEAEQHLSSINNHPTPRSSSALNFMDDRGEIFYCQIHTPTHVAYINPSLVLSYVESLIIIFFPTEAGRPSDPEDDTFKTLTGETIFEHIRTKAKNFPVINKLKVVETESLIQTNERPYKSEAEFSMDTSAVLKGTNSNEVIRDTECGRRMLSGISCNPHGILNASPGGLSNGANLSSSKLLSFDISMFKNPKRPADAGSTMENTRRKHQHSPIVPPRHCSLTAAGKTREVEAFLGFESVFSFL